MSLSGGYELEYFLYEWEFDVSKLHPETEESSETFVYGKFEWFLKIIPNLDGYIFKVQCKEAPGENKVYSPFYQRFQLKIEDDEFRSIINQTIIRFFPCRPGKWRSRNLTCLSFGTVRELMNDAIRNEASYYLMLTFIEMPEMLDRGEVINIGEEKRSIGIQTAIDDASLEGTASEHEEETWSVVQTNINMDKVDISPEMEAMLLMGDDVDVVLNVCGKELKAHKCILKARSPVFRRMFKHNMAEQRSGVVQITDCDPAAFEDFLLHLYSGKFDHIKLENVALLLYIAEKYGNERLSQHCLKTMESNLAVENFGDFVSVVLLCGGNPRFLQAASEFFAVHFELVGESLGWKKFFQAKPLEANEIIMKVLKIQASCACNKK